LHLENPEPGGAEDSAWVGPEGAPKRAPKRPPKRLMPTILLVEDEAFVRQAACEILCSAGYRVLPARNAADAVTAFRGHAHEVRLLLTDVVLPDRNGCDLAEELVTVRSDVKAIFISGYPENCITRDGVQRPGWFYLPKPFSTASLLQKIEEALHPSRRRRGQSREAGETGREATGGLAPDAEGAG
jgi:DNA-binding NtrC family response regulator